MDAEVSTSVVIVGAIISMYFLLLCGGCVAMWVYLGIKISSGKPILEQRESIPATWGLVDVFGGFIAVLVLSTILQLAFMGLANSIWPGSLNNTPFFKEILAVWGFVLGELAICAMLAIAVIWRGGISRFFGGWSNFFRDVKVGVATFVTLCIPVMIIQVLCAQLVEYHHPIIDLLQESPVAWIIVPIAFSAVIVAPICEEYAIRMTLQGWLDDLLARRLSGPFQILLGKFNWNKKEVFEPAEISPGVAAVPHEIPKDDSQVVNAADFGNPYQSFGSEELIASEPVEAEPISLDSGFRWGISIIISAFIFAILHMGQGLAPIPLFFLALGLGYIYQRTRTLTASIVVHMLLNGQSIVMMLIAIAFDLKELQQ